jgi:hypothetical protein
MCGAEAVKSGVEEREKRNRIEYGSGNSLRRPRNRKKFRKLAE